MHSQNSFEMYSILLQDSEPTVTLLQPFENHTEMTTQYGFGYCSNEHVGSAHQLLCTTSSQKKKKRRRRSSARAVNDKLTTSSSIVVSVSDQQIQHINCCSEITGSKRQLNYNQQHSSFSQCMRRISVRTRQYQEKTALLTNDYTTTFNISL